MAPLGRMGEERSGVQSRRGGRLRGIPNCCRAGTSPRTCWIGKAITNFHLHIDVDDRFVGTLREVTEMGCNRVMKSFGNSCWARSTAHCSARALTGDFSHGRKMEASRIHQLRSRTLQSGERELHQLHAEKCIC